MSTSEKIKPHLILVFILFVTVLLRVPSLLEPFWHGDEGVYMALGQALLKGLSLYSDAFDNKPPAIYLLSALSMGIFGHTIWSLRFTALLWSLVSQIVIYLLAKNIFLSKKAGYIAAIIFGLLTATPLIEGHIANGELFFILFTSLGFLYGWRSKYFLAGLSFSLAVLFKAPAIFDFLAFGLFLLIHQKDDSYTTTFKRVFRSGIGFSVPLVVTICYFLVRGHFTDFYFSVLSSNVGYTDYGNRFIIPNGLLFLKAGVLGLIVFFFLKNIFQSWRKGNQLSKTEKTTAVLILWLFFSLYGTLLGGRDFSHYVIQMVPAFTLLLTGLILRLVSLRIGLLALGASLLILAFFGFRPEYWRWNYYPNAVAYLTGNMSQVDFNLSFDRKVSRNYTLGEVTKRLSDPEDKIFIWANEPQVYFLADRANAHRYTTAYHVNNYHGYADVMSKLNASLPKIIITENPYPYPFPELEELLKNYYSLSGDFDDAQIYRLNSTF